MDLDYEIIDGEPWLACEDAFIRQGYLSGVAVAEISRRLKRSPTKVRWRASRLKVKHARAGGFPAVQKWMHLDAAIKQHYAAGGVAAVREVHPDATLAAITSRAQRLGIRRAKETPWYRSQEWMVRLAREAKHESRGKLAARYGLKLCQVSNSVRDGRTLLAGMSS